MKALKPSHREKRRYLLISGKNANREDIEEAILKFIGVLGYAKASPMFVKLEQEKLEKHKGKIILSINREELDKVRAAFLMSGKNIRIEKISGSIS